MAQAEAKIAALQRYKNSGPEAVSEYQANVLAWERSNATLIAAAQTGAAREFDQAHNYVVGYWGAVEEHIAIKQQEIAANAYVPVRPEDNPDFVPAETLEEAKLREAKEALAQVQTATKTANVNVAPAIVTNVAVASEKEVGESEFEAWVQEQTSKIEQRDVALSSSQKEVITNVAIDLNKRLETGEALEEWEWNLLDVIENQKFGLLNDEEYENTLFRFNTYFEANYGNSTPAFIQIEDVASMGSIFSLKLLVKLFSKKALIFDFNKIGGFAIEDLVKEAAKPLANGMTKGGRALQKHSSRSNDILSKYMKSGNSGSNSGYYNPISDRIVRDVLNDKDKKIIEKSNFVEIFSKNGTGVGLRFNKDGTFDTFINP